ncbi:MAG: PilZ domain-containing protein [Candidatus Eremiobacteraeota bacterium]|nr:PilZ domain-containing protein [Candidatus Eremiobacteraeota bacterium]
MSEEIIQKNSPIIGITQKEVRPEESESGKAPAVVRDSSGEVTQERRKSVRKALKLNKIFSGLIGEGLDVVPIYFYIVDISKGGMKITTDLDLPVDCKFHINLTLDVEDPLDTDVRGVWKKKMFGGTNIIGIQFLNPPEKTVKSIDEFMSVHTQEGKRRSYRLNRVLPVEMEIEAKTDKFHTLTLDLSAQGMRISNPFPLPFDKKINMKIMLDFDETPIYLASRIAWQKETSYGQFLAGIQFIDIREEDQGRINIYIDKAISGELDQKIIKELPLEIFDTTRKRRSEQNYL